MPRTTTKPVIELGCEQVQICGTALPRMSRTWTPSAWHVVSETVLDQPTSQALYHVATDLAAGFNVLLHGPAATTKTSLARLLAALTGHELVVLDLAVSPRGAAAEALAQQVNDAVGRRAWLLLEDLGAADPALLSRLCTWADTARPKMLATADSVSVVPAGVRNRFQMVATQPPNQVDCLAMARYLIDGRQPEVIVDGQAWCGLAGLHGGKAPLSALRLRGLDATLRQLAAFHAVAAEATAVGAGSEPSWTSGPSYVYSRRDLRRGLELLNQALARGTSRATAVRQMVETIYVAGLPVGEQAAVRSLARIHGLLESAAPGPVGIAARRQLPQLELLPRRQVVTGAWRGEPLRWRFEAVRGQGVEFATSPRTSAGAARLALAIGAQQVAEARHGGAQGSVLRTVLPATGGYELSLTGWESSHAAGQRGLDFTLAYQLV